MPDKDTTPVVSDEDAARFWAKVDRSGECWRWTGAPDKRGYGRFKIGGQVQYAHRVAYAIQTSQWPGRISWSCDDYLCMRIDHLQTPKSNGRNGRSTALRPHPDFPLFKHDTGRWAKKIRTKFHYFGSVAADPTGEAALNLWLEQKDDLLAGRRPRVRKDAFTVEDLCNHFLEHKEQLKESGELEPRTFNRYFKSCEFLLDHFGKRRVVEDLRPLDFQELRSVMAKRWGPVALGNEIQMVRSAFKFAYEAELIEKPVRFGPGFKKPSAKTLRLERAKGGERMFTPAEIKLLLKHASVNFKAMILLGINSGMGNTDLGLLSTSAIDPESAWLNYPRTKNGIPRRIPLWPETQKSLAKVIGERRQPKDPASADLLFIGKRGEDYVGNHKGYRVTAEMKRTAKSAGVENRSFYDLRRTFQTIGEEPGDLIAVSSIMGHAPRSGDMAAVYRQRISDERLRAVTNHVRRWLLDGKQAL